MAPKGEYDVQQQAVKDNSMRMCVMTLLVFFFICLVLLLIPLLLKKDTQKKETDDIGAFRQGMTANTESTVPWVTEEQPSPTASQTIPQKPPVSKKPTNPTIPPALLSSSTSTQDEPPSIAGETQSNVPYTSTNSVAVTPSATPSIQRTLNQSSTILHFVLPLSTSTSSTQTAPNSSSSITAHNVPLSATEASTTANDSSAPPNTLTTPNIHYYSPSDNVSLSTTEASAIANGSTAPSSTLTTLDLSLLASEATTTATNSTALPSSTLQSYYSNTFQNVSLSTTEASTIANDSTAPSSTLITLDLSLLTSEASTMANGSTTPPSTTLYYSNTSQNLSMSTTETSTMVNGSTAPSSTLKALDSYYANTSQNVSLLTSEATTTETNSTAPPSTTLNSYYSNTSQNVSLSTKIAETVSTAVTGSLSTLNSYYTTTESTHQSTSNEAQENTSYSSSTTQTAFASGTTSIEEMVSTVKTPDILDSVCITGECKNLAGRLLVMMNHSADRCEDYYEYACGGLRSYDFLLEDDPSSNAMSRIEKQLEQFESGQSSSFINATDPFYKYYKSCVYYYDEFGEDKRIEKAKSLLASMGNFFKKEDWKTPNSRVFTETIYNLMTHHSAPFFDVLLDVDTTNTSKFALKLVTSTPPFVFGTDAGGNCAPDISSQASFGLFDMKDLYASYTTCLVNEERTYITDDLPTALKVLSNITNKLSPFIIQETETIRALWSQTMVNGTVSQFEQLSKKFELKTVKELKTEISLIDWEFLFKELINNTAINENTLVQVYFYENFKAFFNSNLEDLSMKLHNALLAMFAHELYFSLVTATEQDDRGSYCLRLADSLMEEFSSALYISSFSPGEMQALQSDLQYIFHHMKETLKERVENSRMLSDTSKKAVTGKVDAMKLATPATSVDESFLHRRIAGMNIVLDEVDFFENTVKLLQRYRTLLYSEYTKNPRDPEQIWTNFILPHHIAGISIYGLNTIAVPYGIAARRRNFHRSGLHYLKHAYLGAAVGRLVARHFAATVIPYGVMSEPFYHTSYPVSKLFAGIGMAMAHEIAHHFDCSGVKYDATGQYKGLNSLISTDEFSTWNESYFIMGPETWSLADGRNVTLEVDDNLRNLWMDELIADQSGLKLALETYKRLNLSQSDKVLPWLGMDAEELFFLSAAQVFCTKTTMLDEVVQLFENEHLPSPARVNFFIANSYDFGQKICSEGTKMNPNYSLKVVPFPEDQIIDP